MAKGRVKKIVRKAKKAVKKAVKNTAERVESRVVTNDVRVWPSATRYMSEYPEQGLSELRSKKNVGVCFSGGGTRSASCSLGQMRALYELRLGGEKLIDKVRYISCISGGSWFAVPYTYLPDSVRDTTFLGTSLEPEQCTLTNLRRMSRQQNSYAYAVSESQMVKKILANYADSRLKSITGTDWGEIDEAYSEAVGQVFLKPFGLGEGIGKLPRFFTWRDGRLDTILGRNKHLKKSDFYRVEKDSRPYLIAGITLLAPRKEAARAGALRSMVIPAPVKSHLEKMLEVWPDMVPFEGTPIYVGTSVTEKVGVAGKRVGGGFIEPLAFDTHAPLKAPGKDLIAKSRVGAIHHRFTLADLMGTCGAAPAIGTYFANRGSSSRSITGIFPRFRHWPVKEKGVVLEDDYNFGDGGYVDSYGIVPLLRRKVKNIICFINTATPLLGQPGHKEFRIDAYLPWLFGAKKYVKGFIPNIMLHDKGTVFQDDRRNSNFLETVNGLIERRDVSSDPDASAVLDHEGRGDRAVFYRGTYRVVTNSYLGVEGGWDVNVLWFYNSRRKQAWESRLPANVQRRIERDPDNTLAESLGLAKSGEFARFPYYRTFLENGLTLSWDGDQSWGKKLDIPEPVDLTKDQVSMLANLSTWAVKDASAEVMRMFRGRG